MSDVDERLRSLVAELLDVAVEPGRDVDRATTGTWDSLNHLRVVMAVEEEFGIRLDPDEVTSVTSLSGLAKLVKEKAGPELLREG